MEDRPHLIPATAFEGMRQLPLGALEERLRQAGHFPLAGIDEAGRGALAGPVVAAAAILPSDLLPFLQAGVKDSKLLSEKKREELYPLLTGEALAFGVGQLSSDEIDRLNILQASRRAMLLALQALSRSPALVLIDGNQPLPIAQPQQCLVAGDRFVLSIGAASVIAKVTRDRIMRQAEARFPGYGFARHKGYGTAAHLEALRRLGPSPLHRRSFAPVLQPELL